MLFSVAAFTKAKWILALGSTLMDGASISPPLSFSPCPQCLPPIAKMPNTFKGLCAFADFLVHFPTAFSIFWLWGASTNWQGRRNNSWYHDLCLNWNQFPSPRSPACLAQTCHYHSMAPACVATADISFPSDGNLNAQERKELWQLPADPCMNHQDNMILDHARGICAWEHEQSHRVQQQLPESERCSPGLQLFSSSQSI